MIRSNEQSGFTLIELVVVIVILGILAATALPKFVDLQADAKLAKANAVAGAIASAANSQWAANKANTTFGYVVASACGNTYLQSGTPAGCSFGGTTLCTITCDGVAATAAAILPP